jgi:tRNA-dihydrouridine synthase A
MEREFEVSLAPMLDVTTSAFRKFVRLTSRKTVLFTEMIVANTINNISLEKLRERLGDYDEGTVVQIGGARAPEVSRAVKILQGLGYQRFNLNCGCPSSRVSKGCFGAILMLNKELVAEIINAVYEECGAVMSLKIRTGVDEHDSYGFVSGFVGYIKKSTPTRTFYIHARKCWLNGLSPKQNRTVPPLNYDIVHSLKREHPELSIILNGAVAGWDPQEIRDLDGIMVGRECIRNIFVFWEMDQLLLARDAEECTCEMGACVDEKGCSYYKCAVKKRAAVRKALGEYFASFDPGTRIRTLHANPIVNLLRGERGCKNYKRLLNELLVGKADIRTAHSSILALLACPDRR